MDHSRTLWENNSVTARKEEELVLHSTAEFHANTSHWRTNLVTDSNMTKDEKERRSEGLKD